MRNFGIVVPGLLYRSGKYTAKQLAQTIQQYGIRQVIDLRDREKPLLSARTYQRIGIVFRRCPLDECSPLPPGILAVWDGRIPTLVHCWKGAHRTGAWVARYRMVYQGWSRDQAIAEMMAYGFGSPESHEALYESIFV